MTTEKEEGKGRRFRPKSLSVEMVSENEAKGVQRGDGVKGGESRGAEREKQVPARGLQDQDRGSEGPRVRGCEGVCERGKPGGVGESDRARVWASVARKR
eukprot:3157484-Rhodomonas_salina.1